jgi:hypothetical protein
LSPPLDGSEGVDGVDGAEGVEGAFSGVPVRPSLLSPGLTKEAEWQPFKKLAKDHGSPRHNAGPAEAGVERAVATSATAARDERMLVFFKVFSPRNGHSVRDSAPGGMRKPWRYYSSIALRMSDKDTFVFLPVASSRTSIPSQDPV